MNLSGILASLKRCRVLVVGDFMLDTYTIGKASRISPEAPVPVVNVLQENNLPGGAGNVVLNLVSMGADVVAMGRVGNDSAGKILSQILRDEKIDLTGMIEEEGFYTPVKNRVIADDQQIVRIDHEKISSLCSWQESRLIALLPHLFEGIEIVALSDYGKGFLTPTLLQAVIAYANAKQIPVIIDPKGFDYKKYAGANIVKPNLSETYAAAALEPEAGVEAAARKILDTVDIQTLMVTRAAEGISLFHADGKREDFFVRAHEVKDVTGAGDTVLAMLTVALASGMTLSDATQLSNIAAGIAIEKIGCARVTIAQLAQRLLELHGTNKVFSKDHQFALQIALEGQKFNILKLPHADALTSDLYKSIKANVQGPDHRLIISLNNPNPDFVNILSSLQEVHSIILEDYTEE